MLAWLEDEDKRKAGRSERVEPPAVVHPDVLLVVGFTRSAVSPTLTESWLLLFDGWSKRPRCHHPVEWEGVPLLDRRHAQRALDALVQLFRSLGHRSAMLTGWSGRRSSIRSSEAK